MTVLLIAAALLAIALAWTLARMATLDGRRAAERDQWDDPNWPTP